METQETHNFNIKELEKKIDLFGFISGYETKIYDEQDPVNIKAAESMAKLHDKLKEAGYEGNDLEIYLVRLLFCLFAEDTGIFEEQSFRELIELKTNEDGSDFGAMMSLFFQTLNTENNKRMKNLDALLNAFPYVNGGLFEKTIRVAAFDSEMRKIMLSATALDWGGISPAIFGSMFQGVMNPKERRNLGAHLYFGEKYFETYRTSFFKRFVQRI